MKAKIIMLEATSNNYGIIEDLYLNPGELILPQPHGDKVKYHNFYLIDESAEIREDDWYIMQFDDKFELMNQVEDKNEAERCNAHQSIAPFCFKIISSTELLQNIPQLSEQSIKLLIDYYNKNDKMPKSVSLREASIKNIYLNEDDINDLNCTDFNKVAYKYGFKYTEDFFEAINESIFLNVGDNVYTIKTKQVHDIYIVTI